MFLECTEEVSHFCTLGVWRTGIGPMLFLLFNTKILMLITFSAGAASQCYKDELMLLKCELMLLKCQINKHKKIGKLERVLKYSY